MFKIPPAKLVEYKQILELHKLYINTMSIYYTNTRLLINKHKYLDRETYLEYFREALNRVEMVSDPIELIIPNDGDDDDDRPFYLNHETQEWKDLTELLPLDVLLNSLPDTNEIVLKIKNNEIDPNDVLEDIFLYFCMYKFYDHVDLMRKQIVTNLSDLIEYVMNKISIKDIDNHRTSKKIKQERYVKNCKDIIFTPEFTMLWNFFKDKDKLKDINIKPFDVRELMMLLTSNIDTKTDILVILGIYEIISCAMFDIVMKPNYETEQIKFTHDISEYMNKQK